VHGVRKHASGLLRIAQFSTDMLDGPSCRSVQVMLHCRLLLLLFRSCCILTLTFSFLFPPTKALPWRPPKVWG
jgi:hypothetical protein